MKTIKKWFEELEEPYRSQALANLNPKFEEEEVDNKADSIMHGFTWEDSREGRKYWIDYYSSLSNQLRTEKTEYQKMLSYAGKYQISIQFWGDGDTNVFIAKDGIELTDFGGLNPPEAIEKTVEYLDRINKNQK